MSSPRRFLAALAKPSSQITCRCEKMMADYIALVNYSCVLHRYNVRIGPARNRFLMTGIHSIADVLCSQCGFVLGWKYVSGESIFNADEY